MPYKDKAKQKEYQRQWIANQRKDFFSGKVCVKCGASDGLELDHTDPEKKLSHRIWSWSKKRKEAEIAKCQILCADCHQEKTNEEHRKRLTGKPNMAQRVYDDALVLSALRRNLIDGVSQRKACAEFSIPRDVLSSIIYSGCRAELLRKVQAEIAVTQ